MNVLIIGLGSIGRRHACNLKAVDPGIRLAALRRKGAPPAPPDVAMLFDEFFECEQAALDWNPDAAVVANPAPWHLPSAVFMARQGIHLLVEKPLACDMPGVDVFLEDCRARSVVLLMGYNLRFHAPLEAMHRAVHDGIIGRVLYVRAAVGQYLPDWRPTQDYRSSVTANANLGGGAILELSHEIDCLRWFGGEIDSVSAIAGHVSDLPIDVEDVAEISVTFAMGGIGSAHMDLIDSAATRSCRLVGTEGTLVWDADSQAVRLYEVSARAWRDLFPARVIDRNDMYVAEMQHFLSCVRGECAPRVTGEDGKRVLHVALAAKQSAKEARVVKV